MKKVDSGLKLPDQILSIYPTEMFETVKQLLMTFFHSLCVCNKPLMYTCETMSHYMSQWYMKNLDIILQNPCTPFYLLGSDHLGSVCPISATDPAD